MMIFRLLALSLLASQLAGCVAPTTQLPNATRDEILQEEKIQAEL